MWKLALWRFKICLTIDKPRPVLPEFLEREGSTLKNLFVKRGIFWVATPMPKSSTVKFTTSLIILILTSIGFFDWLCVMAFSIILKKTWLSSDSSPVIKISFFGIKNLQSICLNNFLSLQIFWTFLRISVKFTFSSVSYTHLTLPTIARV